MKEIINEHEVSIARACRLMTVHRSYFYYVEKKDDQEVRQAIKEASEFGDGFWKIFSRIRRSGRAWNHKKVYRVYKSMCYNKQVKLKKRLPTIVKTSSCDP